MCLHNSVIRDDDNNCDDESVSFVPDLNKQSTSSRLSGDNAEQERPATLKNYYLFPDAVDLQDSPEQSDHNGSEDSKLHNFSSKSTDKETIRLNGQFLPDKHGHGFSDDDGQPNAAGYEHRNRAGKIENGKIRKQQNDEASKEHNSVHQFASEQNMKSSLNKADSMESDAGTPESTTRDQPVYHSYLHPYYYQYKVISNFHSENSDIHYEVLLDAKPSIPHPKKNYGAKKKGLRSWTGHAAEEYSNSNIPIPIFQSSTEAK